jgi:ribosomal protein S13
LEREWENEVKEAKEQRERERAAREREREAILAEKAKKAKEKEEKLLTRLRGRTREKVMAALAKHKATFKTRTKTTVDGTTTKSKPVQPKLPPKSLDPLANLTIETALRRLVRDNIAHQRMIGSYVGRRHAMGMPVRGQNTRSNAKTAKKMNRVDRW